MHVLGSDRAAIERAITQTDRNAAVMSLPVLLSVGGSNLNVKIGAPWKGRVPAAKSGSVRWAKSVPVEIGRGENHGRTITYHNVVRRWVEKLGDWTGTDSTWSCAAGSASAPTTSIPRRSWCRKARTRSLASSSARPWRPSHPRHQIDNGRKNPGTACASCPLPAAIPRKKQGPAVRRPLRNFNITRNSGPVRPRPGGLGG